MWKYYALLSAFFAALTAVFAKIGVKDINSDLATAIRTTVILFITWAIAILGNHTWRLAVCSVAHMGVPHPFGSRHWAVMALLFQSLATG